MKENAKQERKSYQKPKVEQVELVAEEQVLSLCKRSDGGGVGQTTLSCEFVGNCKEEGT